MSCSGILVVELFWSSSPFSCFVDVTVNECLYYHPVTTAFELWCWRRLLRVPWTARRSNQSILKEISPEYSLEGLMLKLQYFGHLMWRTDSFEKTLMLGKIEGGRRRGWQKMRWLDGITDSMDMSLSRLWGLWWTGKPGMLPSMGLDTTEQLNWLPSKEECQLFKGEQ